MILNWKATKKLRTTVLMNNDVYITYVETDLKNETNIILNFLLHRLLSQREKTYREMFILLPPLLDHNS